MWRSEDHYLDIEVRTGSGAELLDVDELLEAARMGLLAPEIAERAVLRAMHALESLARNGYDLSRWLAGENIKLAWRSA